MNDLIRRQDVMDVASCYIDLCNKALDSLSLGGRDRYAIETERNSLLHLKDDMKLLPSVQPEPQWIPCSEKLPENSTEVLVTRRFLGCKDGSHGWNKHIPPKDYVEIATRNGEDWTAYSDEYKVARNRHTDPIAWMRLPEPYQAERRKSDKR